MPHFGSLTSRLILPLLLASVLAASLVAAASYWLADQAAAQQLEQRFAAIDRSLQSSQFPLTRSVLVSLSELTSAHWVTLGANGQIVDSTLAMTAEERGQLAKRLTQLPVDTQTEIAAPVQLIHAQQVFQAKRFRRTPIARRGAEIPIHDVVVLFDDGQWRMARLRAAAAPLATGLSTIVLLSSVTLLLAGRLIHRITRLQRQVEAIAQGNFTSNLPVSPDDEIGRLGRAVQSMAAQLQQMWEALGREHGQRLLHQIAGGLAHNLRNSITGARMAVELHARHCREANRNGAGNEDLQMAVEQLEQTEDYVRRLLLVSSGKQELNRPSTVGECLRDIRSSLDNTARHRGVTIAWDVDERVAACQVADGPTLTAAVTNLVWNALQAGDEIAIVATQDIQSQLPQVRIDVIDNGPGPPAEIAQSLFEPFVTSKPEGLGLGLPLVARSMESLGGTVQWERYQERTRFRLLIPIAT